MADRDDEMMHALVHGISLVYSLLVEACRALPVPVNMPADPWVSVAEVRPAVKRLAALAADQPMGEDQEWQLRSGCIHLLAAIDLYALCETRYEETRADGVGANLATAEIDLKDLLIWLYANK
ncbi:hypothetical protein OG866_27010 [Streptomyces sp. NBC_00663]|uniref:hypothetical protein n=1 Tax=Streptomyces sp. NBC_00663 TaxID=2975801 RepID=UPI002E346AAF|nr:hypothetical protein [Streptomyces sp. NBC_00663]